MEAAISVPDATYERVERLAKRAGMNRSQFYVTAVERYADELESAEITAAIDVMVAVVGADGSNRDAVTLGRRSLADEEREW